MDEQPRARFPRDTGWTDAQGRKAESFEQLAMRRAEESRGPIWYVKVDSWVPVRMQLLAIRVWLWLERVLSA